MTNNMDKNIVGQLAVYVGSEPYATLPVCGRSSNHVELDLTGNTEANELIAIKQWHAELSVPIVPIELTFFLDAAREGKWGLPAEIAEVEMLPLHSTADWPCIKQPMVLSEPVLNSMRLQRKLTLTIVESGQASLVRARDALNLKVPDDAVKAWRNYRETMGARANALLHGE